MPGIFEKFIFEFEAYIYIYIKLKKLIKAYIKKWVKPRSTLYLKQYFVSFYVTLSSLITWKLSKKFYESYSSSIYYQKNSTTKGKIKTNDHFDNALK